MFHIRSFPCQKGCFSSQTAESFYEIKTSRRSFNIYHRGAFTTLSNTYRALTIFAKHSILDV